ncbi:DUF5334 family protein [Inquilinus sp. OTU3971]|uniref:DUF5334 family protein n=1 Tax=Inquilinus sp. OTU3971 TaxID=3043855 RepID=UPI00313C6C25
MRLQPLVLLLALPSPVLAWSGTDEQGANVEIEAGERVRSGEAVEIYDYGSGTYQTIDVDRVTRRDRTVTVEGTDEDGDYLELEMEDE